MFLYELWTEEAFVPSFIFLLVIVGMRSKPRGAIDGDGDCTSGIYVIAVGSLALSLMSGGKLDWYTCVYQ